MPNATDVQRGPARDKIDGLSRRGQELMAMPSARRCERCQDQLGIHNGKDPAVPCLRPGCKCPGFEEPGL